MVFTQTNASSEIGEEAENVPAPHWGCCFTCVPTGSVGLFTKAGSYEGIVEPGRGHFCCGWSQIQIVSLAMQNEIFMSDCKTKDNTLITIVTNVQYRISASKIKTAIFETASP